MSKFGIDFFWKGNYPETNSSLNTKTCNCTKTRITFDNFIQAIIPIILRGIYLRLNVQYL